MQVKDEDRWEKNVKRALAFVDMFPEPRRSNVKRMLDGPIGEQFFTAPASTRPTFHNAFTGGLLDHSLNVVDNARSIASSLAPGMFQDHSVIMAAMFHDLGKCGDGVEPHYLQLKPDDWRRKRGDVYEVNPRCPFMPTGERGVWLLMKHGVDPSYDEMMALRLNDGAGARENEPYAFRTPILALFIHWADMYASVIEKSVSIG